MATTNGLPNNHDVTACLVGRMDYKEAWDLQQRIQDRLIDIKRNPVEGMQHPGHVMLLVEHPHVFTLGKNGHASNLLLNEHQLAEREATFYHIDRGGDITYHGPGQLVGYPILDLGHFYTDIHRYLRELEEVMILTCADYGITSGRVEGRTGVWVGPDASGEERKICAMGIRCSRWVTMHGFALNMNTNLDYFSYIVPCGITDRGVTSLARELGRPVDEAEVIGKVGRHFSERFEASLRLLQRDEATSFLDSFLQVPTGSQA